MIHLAKGNRKVLPPSDEVDKPHVKLAYAGVARPRERILRIRTGNPPGINLRCNH
jgi:hypothetical protein